MARPREWKKTRCRTSLYSPAPRPPRRPASGSHHRIRLRWLFSARKLAHTDVDVTIIAKTSHHLFQPLLYQVATGVLSQGEIAPATREVLRGQKNAEVLLGEVTTIDVEARTVTSETPVGETVTSYDTLIVAAGAGQSYFGNDHFAEFAPGMKSIDDASSCAAGSSAPSRWPRC